MTEVQVQAPDGELMAYVAKPSGTGPWPAVCVIHDAIGMTQDLRNQADWLASAGYLVAAPDLFKGRTFLGCLRRMIIDFTRREGPLFERVEATRQWLEDHQESTGQVGLIGFCFGGGFALLLAPSGGYSAVSVNYGNVPKDAEEFLQQSCPIIASYGAKDRSLKGAAEKLETALTAANVEHDIKVYPDAYHGFMNDHDEKQVPFFIKVVSSVVGGGEHHPESAADARERIIAFFNNHLQSD